MIILGPSTRTHNLSVYSKWLLLLATLAFVSTTSAASPLQIGLGQILLPPPGVPVMAGFGSFTNNTADDVVVVSAKSAAFEKVEIHQTTVENDVARMRKVKDLIVPANASVELKHGGMHLMLKKPRNELALGQHVLIELELATGETVTAHFEVMEGMQQHKSGHDMKKMEHGDSDDEHNGHTIKN